MSKIFQESNFKIENNIVKDFKLFKDIGGMDINEQYRKEIIENAKRLLDSEYKILPATVYMQYKQNGNRSVYQKLFFDRRSQVLSFMLAEYFEGKGRFVDKLVDGIWLILEETTWVVPAHFKKSYPLNDEYGDKVTWVDLFSAETASTLAWIYYLGEDILDNVTPVIRERILYELNRRIIEPYMTYDNMWWMGFNGGKVNNWNPWIVSNVLTVCALCVNDNNKRKDIVSRSVEILDYFSDGYYDDGGCDEGPGYWGAAGAAYFDCLELLYDISGGHIDVFEHDLVKKMGEYIAKVHINEDYYLNFADCSARVTPDFKMVARFGRRTGSKLLENFGCRYYEENGVSTPRWHLYRYMKDLCETIPDNVDYTCFNKTWFDGICVKIEREKQKTKDGLYLAVKGGNNAESHNHNDIGNFVVYSDGKPLLIDVGVGTYTADTFSKNRYKIWTMQSAYHNVPTINGIMQQPGLQYHASDIKYDDITGKLTMSLKSAYPKNAEIDRYYRSASLTDGKIVITDDIKLKTPGEVTFNLMTLNKPDLSKPGVIKFKRGRTAQYDNTLKVKSDEIHIEDSRISKGWRSNKMYRIRLTTEDGFENNIFKLIIK